MASFLKGWFVVRRDLSRGRRAFLAALSFVLPFALWCFVSYVPWIWHPDVKLEVASTTDRISAVFTAGNRLSKEFFPTYVEAVRLDNAEALKAAEAGEAVPGVQRANRVLLRQLAPIAVRHGWLASGSEQDDATIYHLWRDLATGTKTTVKPALSEENLAVIKANWATLSALSADFDSKKLPQVPLQ
jgi:NitT/TauT family transport system permease protein